MAFLGTPDIAAYCLKSVLKDEHFQVVGVVSQPDRPAGRKMQLTPSRVKTVALEHNKLALGESIPILTPESINRSEALAEVASWRAEAVIVVAFGQILKQKFLDLFPQKVVNIHASLLPRWRGAAPIQRAIMAGDTETGVCLQIVTRQLDAGAILGQRKFPLTEGIDALQAHEKMKPLAADLLAIEFMDYLRGNLTPIEQDESLVTYAPKIDKAEAMVDWTLSAQEISQNFRGLMMGPGSKMRLVNKTLKIHSLKVEAYEGSLGAPGDVLALEADGWVVACGKGSVRILEVQPESRARMKVGEFFKGTQLQLPLRCL